MKYKKSVGPQSTADYTYAHRHTQIYTCTYIVTYPFRMEVRLWLNFLTTGELDDMRLVSKLCAPCFRNYITQKNHLLQ